MAKNLLKKVVVGGMIVGAGLLGSGCRKVYNIDGSKVHYNMNGNLIEINGENKIKYTAGSSDHSILLEVKVNGNNYSYSDRDSVYLEAEKRYTYLWNKINKIENDNAEAQKAREKKKQDLNVIRGLK